MFLGYHSKYPSSIDFGPNTRGGGGVSPTQCLTMPDNITIKGSGNMVYPEILWLH